MEAADIDFCMVTILSVLVEAVIPAWNCQYVSMTTDHMNFGIPIDGILNLSPVANFEVFVKGSLDGCAGPIVFVIVVLLPDDRDPLPVISMPRVLKSLVSDVFTSRVHKHERSIDSK